MISARHAAALAIALTVLPGAALAGGDDPAAMGHDLAEELCGRCHALESKGDSPFPAAPPFREVVRRWAPENLQEALAEGIVVGHRAMPKFELDPVEVSDLIAYLKTLR